MECHTLEKSSEGEWDMLDIEWTPVQVIQVINDPFRVFTLFVFVVLAVIVVINSD